MKNILSENPWANRDVHVAILTILFFLITSRFFTLILLWSCLQEHTEMTHPYKWYFVSYLCWCCTLSSWVWVLLNLNTCFSFLIIEKFFVFLDKVYWLPCGCIFRNHLAQSSVCNKWKMSMSRELDHIESQKYYLVLHISHHAGKVFQLSGLSGYWRTISKVSPILRCTFAWCDLIWPWKSSHEIWPSNQFSLNSLFETCGPEWVRLYNLYLL